MSFLLRLSSLSLLIVGPALAQAPMAAKPVGMTLQQFQAIGRDRLIDRDADGDGKISKAEFEAAAPSRRAKAAKTPIDAEAPTAGAGPMARGMGDRAFERFDTNHDGSLDKAEIDAMLARRFERMDVNHDGILTAEERQAARGGMRGRMNPEQ